MIFNVRKKFGKGLLLFISRGFSMHIEKIAVTLLAVFIISHTVLLKCGECSGPSDGCRDIKACTLNGIDAMKLNNPDKYRDFLYVLKHIRKTNKQQELSISTMVAKAIVDHVHWEKYYFISEEHRFNFLSVLVGIIHVESRFDPAAVSDKNARGLMQVHWPTWKKYFSSPDEAHDLRRNLSVGTGILRLYMGRSNNNLRVALYRYLGTKDDRYADKVIGNAVSFRNGVRGHPAVDE